MNTVPRVTVGVPVFNGEKWLADTVQSVLAQSLKDLIVIISDNASSDSSWEMALELAEDDDRVRCYRNDKNLGVFRNLDRVFELSSTPYFKWCSVGDLLAESFLERSIDVLEKNSDVVLAYSRTRFFGSLAHETSISDLNVSLESRDPVLRYRAYLSAYGLNSPFHGLIRSCALARTGLNKGFIGSDHCLIAALLLQGRFVRLEEELLYRRIERDTATATKSREELDEFFGREIVSRTTPCSWKIELQLSKDLLKTQIGSRIKRKVARFLIRRLYWQRRKLLEDIWFSLKGSFS